MDTNLDDDIEYVREQIKIARRNGDIERMKQLEVLLKLMRQEKFMKNQFFKG